MSITLTNGPVAAQVSSTTVSVALTGCVAGRGIICGIRLYSNTITVSSVTCTSEADLTVSTIMRGQSALSYPSFCFAYLPNITTNGDKTITCTFSSAVPGNAAGMFAMEVAGQEQSASFFDLQADAIAANPNNSVSLSPSVDHCFIVAQATSGVGDPTAGAGFTLITLANVGSFDSAEYQLDSGTAGARNVPFGSMSSGFHIAAASFKPTSATPLLSTYFLGSDISTGNWTNSATGSTPLYTAVDETVADDSDYIQSGSNPVADQCEMQFANVGTPSVNTNHTVSYRLSGTGSLSTVVALVQGTTVIASWTHSPTPSTFTTYNQALTAGQIASITDYSSLHLRVTAG